MINVELPSNQSKTCTWTISAPEGYAVKISSFGVYDKSTLSTSASIDDGIDVTIFDDDVAYTSKIRSITKTFGEKIKIIAEYDHQKRTHRDANLALLFTIKYVQSLVHKNSRSYTKGVKI